MRGIEGGPIIFKSILNDRPFSFGICKHISANIKYENRIKRGASRDPSAEGTGRKGTF